LGAWHTTARYTTALVEVAFTDVDPEIAIARAEASWQEAEQQALLQ
jgi:hypothetical protein